jgi:hypothetical protein
MAQTIKRDHRYAQHLRPIHTLLRRITASQGHAQSFILCAENGEELFRSPHPLEIVEALPEWHGTLFYVHLANLDTGEPSEWAWVRLDMSADETRDLFNAHGLGLDGFVRPMLERLEERVWISDLVAGKEF